jgi:hypothetical protein
VSYWFAGYLEGLSLTAPGWVMAGSLKPGNHICGLEKKAPFIKTEDLEAIVFPLPDIPGGLFRHDYFGIGRFVPVFGFVLTMLFVFYIYP